MSVRMFPPRSNFTHAAPLLDTGGWGYNALAGDARADAVSVSDAVCTNGSAVVTSATASFKAADVGKLCFLGGTDTTSSHALRTTIASYQSATQVTLSANSPYTGTAQRFTYGTDNGAYLQATLDAHLRVFLPAGDYVIGSTLALRDYARLEGAGMFQTTLHYFPAALNTHAVSAVAKTGVTLEHLKVLGYGSRGVNQVKTHYTFSGCADILLRNCTDCTVRSVSVEGGALGIWCDNTLDDRTTYTYTTNSGHVIEGCRASYVGGGSFYVNRADRCKWANCDSVWSGSDGFKVQSLSRNCTFANITARHGGRDGMDTYDGLVESTISNAVFTDNKLFGIEMKGLFGGLMSLSDYVDREIAVSNVVTARNGDCGFAITSVHNATFANLMSVGDGFTPYTDPDTGVLSTLIAGIRFTNCQNLTLASLAASKGAYYGIAFDTCSRITGSSMLAMDNAWVDGTTGAGLYAGVYFTACGAIQLKGIRSGNSVATGTTPQVGRQANAAEFDATTSQVQLMGLNAMGCITGEYLDAGTNYVSELVDKTAATVTGLRHVPYTGGVAGHAGGTAPVGRLVNIFRALPADNSSPDLPDGNLYYTQNTFARDLTDLGGGMDGLTIRIHVRDAFTTLKHLGGGIGHLKSKTGADRLLRLDEWVVMTYYNGYWYEEGFRQLASDLTGVLPSASLPTGDFTWDVGSGKVMTITRAPVLTNGLTLGSVSSNEGKISIGGTSGFQMNGRTGSVNSMAFANAAGGLWLRNPVGTTDAVVNGNLSVVTDLTCTKFGCNGAAAVARRTVSGSRGANAALASLLTGLATIGLITDSTTV